MRVGEIGMRSATEFVLHDAAWRAARVVALRPARRGRASSSAPRLAGDDLEDLARLLFGERGAHAEQLGGVGERSCERAGLT